MILLNVVTAYAALNSLMEKEFTFADAYRLLGLKRKLKTAAEFYSEKERELAALYGKKDEVGRLIVSAGGEFAFQDEEAGIRYQERKRELALTEIQKDWESVTVRAPERVRPAVIEALMGFVDFQGKDEEK